MYDIIDTNGSSIADSEVINFFDINESYNGSLLQELSESNNTLPENLRFTKSSLTVVLIYSALFVIAAIGNLTVFINIFRSTHRKSRITLMIIHLAIADLLVTFIMIPLEIGWRITIKWIAGNFACKTFQFLKAFALYLSSNVLVCVSLDRYFAVLYPLKVTGARRRGKYMLLCAWCVSALYSLPQSLIFHVATHPNFPSFRQCVTFGFFPSNEWEIAYNVSSLMAMYFVPLLVIIVAYTSIMCEIFAKSRESTGDDGDVENKKGKVRLRRTQGSNIERARSKTLKMTITIVVVFILCWTPYVVITLLYMFGRSKVEQLPNWLQDALFMTAVSNSCMNPIVYGSYVINFRKKCNKCLCCIQTTRQSITSRKCAVGSGMTRSTVTVRLPNGSSPAETNIARTSSTNTNSNVGQEGSMPTDNLPLLAMKLSARNGHHKKIANSASCPFLITDTIVIDTHLRSLRSRNRRNCATETEI